MGVEMFQLRWVYVVHESNFFSLFKLHTIQKPFGYVGVLQEESVEPSDGQRNVLNQLKDWDLWYVAFLVVGVCLSLLKLNLYSPSPLHLPPIFAWNNSTIRTQHTKQSKTASTQSQTTITGDHSSSVSL